MNDRDATISKRGIRVVNMPGARKEVLLNFSMISKRLPVQPTPNSPLTNGRSTFQLSPLCWGSPPGEPWRRILSRKWHPSGYSNWLSMATGLYWSTWTVDDFSVSYTSMMKPFGHDPRILVNSSNWAMGDWILYVSFHPVASVLNPLRNHGIIVLLISLSPPLTLETSLGYLASA